MWDLIDFCIDKLEKTDIKYGDIRFSRTDKEYINIKNGKTDTIKTSQNEGYGIRVIDGGWGFASSDKLTKEGIKETIKRARKIARASSKLSDEITLKEIEIHQDSYTTPHKKDPFDIEISEKLDYLMDVDKRMNINDKIKVRNSNFTAWKILKKFASTEGARIDQELIYSGGGVSLNASNGKNSQSRSYPYGPDFATKGYEFFEKLDLVNKAGEIAQQAVDLLDAEQCPKGKMDIILDTNQLALHIHESCGHPTELDRVFGTEASYAGTSFLTPDKLNNFKYGSDIVNIVSDATTKGGLGTFGYDDEGVKAKKVDLIRNGRFVGYQTSREDAAKLGVEASGNMRAEGWQNLPLVRMNNINLEPGDWTKEEIIEETDKGLIFNGPKSYSIDDKRLNFQFGSELGYLVENGEIKKLIKNPTYTGISYKFWRNCDAIAGKDDWRLHGDSHCGKGEPHQDMKVGHGCAPSRFKNIRVGVGKW